MLRDKRFLLIYLTIVLFLPIRAQSYNAQQIELAEQLHSLANNAPPELAYIQTSKDIYETGEDLWFKVYLLDAQYLIPSTLSKTLYLQLLNENNKQAVWQEKYKIQNGYANGRVYLETTLPEGDYLLAAYTPNSFFNDTTEFKAIRRIKVKTDMTYRPSISAKFDKFFYGGTDSIRILLSPLSEQGDSLYAEITATLKQGNKKLEKVQTTSNGEGKSVIAFRPQDTKEGLQVAINVKYKDRIESLIMPVPGKASAIQFTTFPEGGDLVSGIKSKLAFKAVNINGEPVDIKGILFEDNTPLLEFKSTRTGMGSFGFIPSIDKKYFIRLSEPAIDSTFLLPEINDTGMTLQLVERDKESLSFKVSQSRVLKQEDIYLRVQCRGVVYGMTMAKLRRELRIKVPLSGLPQGIAEVTLFNSSLLPVAERLVYINQDLKLNIAAELSKEIYPTRGKATLKISVKDEKGQPIVANLGISIFDKLYQNLRDSNNIIIHYYLSTQLKGKIYNPSYYFNNYNKGREEALDLLILTQGWRKYLWNEMNLGKSEEPQQVISDGIHGAVYYPHRHIKVPKRQVFVMAFSPNRDSLNFLIPADSAGGFYVSADLLKRWETDYIYLKPLGPPGSQFTMHILDPLALPEFILGIKLTDPFDIINSIIKNHEFRYPLSGLMRDYENPSDSYVAGNGLIKIKEVTIKGRKQNIIRGKYLGILDSMASKDDYVCVYGVLNCPRHPSDEPSPILFEPNGYGEKKPIPGKEYYVIYNYNTPVEHVRTIVYRQNRYSEEDLLKINNLARVRAYYGVREFYKPDYDKETEDSIIPDFRNTLLWEPSVITDEKGEANLSFFCSDINTDFIGRIEGVSGEGLLGTEYFKFTVRKLKFTP
jgi:hypothetical protein